MRKRLVFILGCPWFMQSYRALDARMLPRTREGDGSQSCRWVRPPGPWRRLVVHRTRLEDAVRSGSNVRARPAPQTTVSRRDFDTNHVRRRPVACLFQTTSKKHWLISRSRPSPLPPSHRIGINRNHCRKTIPQHSRADMAQTDPPPAHRTGRTSGPAWRPRPTPSQAKTAHEAVGGCQGVTFVPILREKSACRHSEPGYLPSTTGSLTPAPSVGPAQTAGRGICPAIDT